MFGWISRDTFERLAQKAGDRIAPKDGWVIPRRVREDDKPHPSE